MLRVHPLRVDLLLQDADLALQVAHEHPRLGPLLPLSGQPLIQGRDGLRQLVILPLQVLRRQAGLLQLVRHDGLLLLQLLQLGLDAGRLRQEGVGVAALQLLLQAQVLLGRLRLFRQGPHLLFQLRENVRHTHQVLLLILQLLLGHRLAALELHNARRLVEQLPALLRLSAENLVDLALADDGIPLFSDTGVVEQLVDILQPALASVHPVLTLPGAVDAAGDGHLVVVHRQLVVRVVQGDGHRGEALGLSQLRAGENHVLHAGSPQLLYLLLSQHPADRVRHVALATAVGAHYAGDAVVKLKYDLVGK